MASGPVCTALFTILGGAVNRAKCAPLEAALGRVSPLAPTVLLAPKLTMPAVALGTGEYKGDGVQSVSRSAGLQGSVRTAAVVRSGSDSGSVRMSATLVWMMY